MENNVRSLCNKWCRLSKHGLRGNPWMTSTLFQNVAYLHCCAFYLEMRITYYKKVLCVKCCRNLQKQMFKCNCF
ncbi:unnamed protein product [Tenebrio molitor]|nr:unnamed protein product [Tenebrio molitor]